MKTCWADFRVKHCSTKMTVWSCWKHNNVKQEWIHSNQASIRRTLANKRVCRPFKCITVRSHISKEDTSHANLAWNDNGTGCRQYIWSKHKMALIRQQTLSSCVFWLTTVIQSEYHQFKSKVSARGAPFYLLYLPITKSVEFLGFQLPIGF